MEARRLVPLCVLSLALLPSVLTAQPTIPLDARGARVHPALPSGEPLTPPSQASALEVVTGFLSERHAGRTLDSLVLHRRFEHDGTTFLRLGQRVGGLDVYGTYVRAAVNRHGELIHLIENLHTPPAAGTTAGSEQPAGAIDVSEALAAAIEKNHPGRRTDLAVTGGSGNSTFFETDGFFWTEPRVTRVALPMRSGTLPVGFLVETWEADSNLLYHTLVHPSGRVLGVQLRTARDSYNVFPVHPDSSAQTILPGPGAGNAESPVGWLFPGDQLSTDIAGNNCHAYLDVDSDNAPDPGSEVVSNGDFLAVASLTQDPRIPPNPSVAVQNAFFHCNVIHDTLYRHGFTEAAGNFQQDNFGQGGVGGDPVNAENQDGSGTNGANFSTPPDGASPRMQQFLWTLSDPRRDGALDSDLLWHESSHGLTWRLIGGMSGPLAGAIGEGVGDGLAALVTDDDVIGEYIFDDPAGIRSAPFTDYPRTYGDFTGTSVHFDGEIYAAILWDLKDRYAADGLSLETLLGDLVGGMLFTPSGPAFEDMRDGILAEAGGSGRECRIWESFARFGVGVGAQADVSGGGPFGGGDVTVEESFEVPAECGGGTPVCPKPCSLVIAACGGTGTAERCCQGGSSIDCTTSPPTITCKECKKAGQVLRVSP
jgi:extracellular elastinolytic metalloproteinase